MKIISEAVKKPSGRVSRKLSRAKSGTFWIFAIVSCELHFGLEKKPSKQSTDQFRKILRSIPVLDFPAIAATTYGFIRADLERRG